MPDPTNATPRPSEWCNPCPSCGEPLEAVFHCRCRPNATAQLIAACQAVVEAWQDGDCNKDLAWLCSDALRAARGE